MKKLLRHMNIIYYIFLLLGGVMLLAALPFMTQYNTVTINTEQINGVVTATSTMTNARGQDQQFLFDYYTSIGKELDWNTVYNFQNSINTVNTLILVFGIVMLLGGCLLCVLQNHKRKIYYASNVTGAVFVGLAVIGFGAYIAFQLFTLMSAIGANTELFNNVAVLQHPTMRAEAFQNAANISSYYFVNVATVLGYLVAFVVCIAYTLFVLILTFAKFSRTKERRKEIIAKAVENND